MKTMKLLSYAIFVIFLGFAINSCTGDDGATGPAGADGQDGNANVSIISLSADDFTWNTGFYLDIMPASVYTLSDASVNQDIIDHGTVLGYSHFINPGVYDEWINLPFILDLGSEAGYIIHSYSLNSINLYAYVNDGNSWNPDPIVPEYRFLLITDSTVTGGKSTATANILEDLKNAGVDVNDYYAVCDYYGVDAE